VSNNDFCSSSVEVGQEHALLNIVDESTEWYPDDQVVTIFAVLVLASTMFSTFSAEVSLIDEVAQRAELRVSTEDNAATISTVAAIGSSARPVFLAEETDAPAPAIPGFRVNPNFIDKVHKCKKPLAGRRKEMNLVPPTERGRVLSS
jgi:hypothetical protein